MDIEREIHFFASIPFYLSAEIQMVFIVVSLQ
jgi:hypothetical protein